MPKKVLDSDSSTDLSTDGGVDSAREQMHDPKRTQHARFLETARALGCDEDEATFDEKLKGIAKPVPKPDAAKNDD